MRWKLAGKARFDSDVSAAMIAVTLALAAGADGATNSRHQAP